MNGFHRLSAEYGLRTAAGNLRCGRRQGVGAGFVRGVSGGLGNLQIAKTRRWAALLSRCVVWTADDVLRPGGCVEIVGGRSSAGSE